MTIQPYRLEIPQLDLDDLRRRLASARWPSAMGKHDDWSRGVPTAYLKQLAAYWHTGFDWRKQESWLNSFEQYTADIDGHRLHFFHVKSRERHALPLMLLHGWPSSNVEFVGMIDRLTDPVAHGGSADDAFHVVVPATPGFGLSSPLREPWDAQRTAKAYSHLMSALGYERWGVHGGDVGSDIAGEINHIDRNLVGVHVSTDMPSIVWFAKFTGSDPAQHPGLSSTQKEEVESLLRSGQDDGAYLEIQNTRPLTIGYLLNDSPVGQLAWIVEKFKLWTARGDKLPEHTVDLDQLLTNISAYWFMQSGASAAHFLSTNLHAVRDWGRPSLAPMGMAVFGARSWARTLQDPEHQLQHWSEFPDGGHFPAMEVPDLLATDLRAFFRSVA